MTLAFAHTVALTCGCAVYVPKAALSSAPPGCSCPAGVWRRTACWQQPSCVHARVARARLWVCTHACVSGRLSVCPYACLQGMSARVYARGRVACRCCQHVFTRKHVVVRACMIVRADLCVPAQLPGGRIRRRSHGGNRKLALRLRRAGHSLPLSSREPLPYLTQSQAQSHAFPLPYSCDVDCRSVAVPHRRLACTPAARRCYRFGGAIRAVWAWVFLPRTTRASLSPHPERPASAMRVSRRGHALRPRHRPSRPRTPPRAALCAPGQVQQRLLSACGMLQRPRAMKEPTVSNWTRESDDREATRTGRGLAANDKHQHYHDHSH